MTPAADRFDPSRSLPEIDPHGGRRPAGTGAPSDEAPQAAPEAFDPWAKRRGQGRAVITTTGGGAEHEQAAPSPAERPRASADQGRHGPYAEQKQLTGKKAIAAWEREQEEKRRAAEEAARREADRESRGVAGFADRRSRAAGITVSNPDYAPSAVYVAQDATRPQAPKKWYRKWAIMVPIAVLATAALVVGLGWPAYRQMIATAQADEAAAAYQRAMTAYELAWTEEHLDALVGTALSGALAESDDPLAQPVEAQQALDGECGKLDAASRAMSELAESPPPALAELGSTQLSSAYQAAAAQDLGFAAERQAAETVLEATRAAMPELSRFCQNFRLGLAVQNTAATRDATELQALRTLAPGQAAAVGDRQIPCEDPLGCPDFANEDALKAYAQLWGEVGEERDEALIAHYDGQCWLSALTAYCVLMSDAVETRRDAAQDIESAMGQAPSANPAEAPFPKLDAAMQEAGTAYRDAEELAYLEAGKTDPAVLADRDPAWEVRMIGRMLDSFERHLDEAVDACRDDLAS